MSDPFMASIDSFVDKANANIETVCQKTFIKILAQLVTMSPVGNPELWKVNTTAKSYNDEVKRYNLELMQDPNNLTPVRKQLKKRAKVVDSMAIKKPAGYTGGRFRGNWQVSFDAPASNEVDRIDPSGKMTTAVGNLTIGEFRVGMTQAVYFTNNVPYAYRLEFGHSSQAPNGMVRVTAEEFQKFFSEASREISK